MPCDEGFPKEGPEACIETLREEDVQWWPLVPLMDEGTPGTRELTKCFLATWQWTVEVAATKFCPPAPTMLNIGQFLDEEMEEGDHMPWLLAYVCTLQCMGEATVGRTWCPMGMHLTPQVSPLVDAFIEETGAEFTELSIAACWGQLAMEVPLQKQDGPFTDVIAFLEGLACHVQSQKAWDELVFLAPLAEASIPCRSTHLSYILDCTVDFGGTLPPLRFHMTEPSGKLMGVACRLLFKGNVLTYDPASNGVEWVLVWGTVNNLFLQGGCICPGAEQYYPPGLPRGHTSDGSIWGAPLGAHTCAPHCGTPCRSCPSCQGGGSGAGATTGGKGV